MFQWISSHSGAINAIANVAMLLVWLAYLQVFLQSFRRQRRPKIVINQAAGSRLDASCFISNMSSEAVYIESVIATLRWAETEITVAITDYQTTQSDQETAENRTFQGPLRQAEYSCLGTFNDIIRRVAAEGHGEPLKAEAPQVKIEILVVGDHQSDDLLVGAKRAFVAQREEDGWSVVPVTAATKQMRSRRDRSQLRKYVEGQAKEGRS